VPHLVILLEEVGLPLHQLEGMLPCGRIQLLVQPPALTLNFGILPKSVQKPRLLSYWAIYVFCLLPMHGRFGEPPLCKKSFVSTFRVDACCPSQQMQEQQC